MASIVVCVTLAAGRLRARTHIDRVDDESNADTRWRRNLLRHDIFPGLQKSLPQYRQHLCRTARLMADAADVLDEVARQDLLACWRDGGLDLSAWLALSPARQRLVLLEWLRQLSEPLPTPAALEEFQHQVITSQVTAHPALALTGYTLIRFAGKLLAIENLCRPLPESSVLPPLRQACSLDVFEWSGRLTLEWRPGGLAPEMLAAGAVLRPRVGGERLVLKVGRKPVKTLLQEHGMPPLLRQQWPLLYSLDDKLLAIPGVAVAADCQSSSLGLWPIWQSGVRSLGVGEGLA
ncbi:tRNA lysidine(34) synthetase TilS [Paludibacterium sp. dN 18-1]|uniref:tRNA lysidine(34) synthetase TilS n=1 Tax=Paludibacterium denitrificans TaxID=2675226 RepID=A0A844GBL3_9NEIS|nr:tRNA lysidine(34) synthetase TilS [Paludibacterium denitrificans]MTD33843.1 tRNA lysidine(34) synthetase TilS [Paludibacterium denitrificans]